MVLRILNGRMGADKGIGKCMFVGSTGKSLADYVIVGLHYFLSFIHTWLMI